MSEPIYIRQRAFSDLSDQAAVNDWLDDVLAEASLERCTWSRVSWDEEAKVVLVEGWPVRPLDEGAPRFALTVGTP